MFDKLFILGNLGRDPELRYLPDGRPVTSMSVAANRAYTNKSGETVKDTVWYRVSVFGKLADACAKYLRKGSQVFVEGRLTADKATGGPRIWTKQDGASGASFEVVASLVKFLGSKNDAEVVEDEDANTEAEASDGDVPF
jgi:single-strand DNA-binding protein